MNMIPLVRETEQGRAQFVNRKLCLRIVVCRGIPSINAGISLFGKKR